MFALVAIVKFFSNSSSPIYPIKLFQGIFWPKSVILKTTALMYRPMQAGDTRHPKEGECSVSFIYITSWGVFPALSRAALIPVLATELETLDMLVGTCTSSRSLMLRCILKVGRVHGNINPLAGLWNDLKQLSSYWPKSLQILLVFTGSFGDEQIQLAFGLSPKQY